MESSQTNQKKSESNSNPFLDFFKGIFNDKKKLIIFISIILVIIIIIIVVAVVVSKKNKDDDYKNECGVPDEQFKVTIKELKKHNEYRKQHQASELTINCDLMDIAQKYSKKLNEEFIFGHSYADYNGQPMGENLYYISGTNKYEPPDATRLWYEEIKDYDFETGKSINGNMIGHFTQVVWTDTKEIGVGITCKNKYCVVVANYFPAGNYIGQFTEKVLPKSR